jgi:hypothetical protein
VDGPTPRAAPPAAARSTREAPLYRPFGGLAYGTTLAVATPLGIRMLGGLHWGWGAVAPETAWLHAHLQTFGFFGVLILGVAQHLVPRFAGRPLTLGRVGPWLAAAMGAALTLRVAGWLGTWPALLAAAAATEALVFAVFGLWIGRALAAPPLGGTRRALAAATGWLVAACLVETGARLVALARGAGVPPSAWLGAAHVMGIYGGVLGWMVGVLVRAGPMFVPGWRLAAGLAGRAWLAMGLGVAVAGVGEAMGGRAPGPALAPLGEALALGTAVLVVATGGLWRRPRPGGLPLHGRGGPEAVLFRLAWASAGLGVVGLGTMAALEALRIPPSLLADATRHLVTVGVLAAVGLAMTFRLVPVFEGRPHPWPRIRAGTAAALVTAVVLRTVQVAADYGGEAVLRVVPLSGVLTWTALAGGATSLLAVAARGPRPPV